MEGAKGGGVGDNDVLSRTPLGKNENKSPRVLGGTAAGEVEAIGGLEAGGGTAVGGKGRQEEARMCSVVPKQAELCAGLHTYTPEEIEKGSSALLMQKNVHTE